MSPKRFVVPMQGRFLYLIAGLAAGLALGPALLGSQRSAPTSPPEAQLASSPSLAATPPAHSVFLGFASQFEARGARRQDMSPLHLARHNGALAIQPPAAPLAAAEPARPQAFELLPAAPRVATLSFVAALARPISARVPDSSPLVFERAAAAPGIHQASAVALVPAAQSSEAPNVSTPARRTRLAARAAFTAGDRRPRLRDFADAARGARSPSAGFPLLLASSGPASPDNGLRYFDEPVEPRASGNPFSRESAPEFEVPRRLPTGAADTGPVLAAFLPRVLGSESLRDTAPRVLRAESSGELVFHVTPEPGTASLLGLGLAALALRRRRAE